MAPDDGETVSALMQRQKAQILQWRREAMRAATAFARACEEGDPERLHRCAEWVNDRIGAWLPAMRKVARLARVSPEIQEAFLPIWIEHKCLPLVVGDRPVMAAALRVLMPGGYVVEPLTLYRGAHSRERRRPLYGFSWTTDIEVARQFARNWSSGE